MVALVGERTERHGEHSSPAAGEQLTEGLAAPHHPPKASIWLGQQEQIVLALEPGALYASHNHQRVAAGLGADAAGVQVQHLRGCGEGGEGWDAGLAAVACLSTASQPACQPASQPAYKPIGCHGHACSSFAPVPPAPARTGSSTPGCW